MRGEPSVWIVESTNEGFMASTRLSNLVHRAEAVGPAKLIDMFDPGTLHRLHNLRLSDKCRQAVSVSIVPVALDYRQEKCTCYDLRVFNR